ncbi:MAG: SMC family ATPase [Candidatus Bathyarchaeia archaeon]|jgi:exonuclease SbcC
MIIQSITLRDFKSYAEQTIDLTNIDAIGICGPNGAGKSTLIEAVTFALFGKCTSTERKELGNEAIIRDNEDEAFVSLTFEKDEEDYAVERTVRKKGTGTATLTSNGKTIQAGAANVTAMVQSIVGMDYETFVSSTIIRQDEMDKISDLRPGERKEILSKIFGLELYEQLKKNAHEKHAKAKADVDAAELLSKQLTPLVTNEGRVRDELEKAETTSKQLDAQIVKDQEELNRLEVEIAKAIKKKSDYDVKHTQFISLEREINSINSLVQSTGKEILAAKESEKEHYALKEELEKTENLELQRLEIEGLKEQLTTNILQQEQQARSLKETIAQEQEHYNTIQNSKTAECPVCKRSLDEEHRQGVLKQFNSKLSELTTELQKIRQQSLKDREKLDREITPRLREIENRATEIQKLQIKKARIDGAASQLPRLIESEKGLKSKLRTAETEKGKLELELAGLNDVAQLFEKLDGERKTTSKSLAKLQEERGRVEESIKHFNEQVAQIAKANEELDRVKRQVAAQAETIPIYEILEDAFGKDGIPTAILKDLVPEVEDGASRILQELSNGGMRISFQFGRETRAGTQTDELVVEAEDDAGRHPVTRFSGGERMRINLALRLGISEVIARRSGYKGKIETLIIDEGLSALDEEGRQATIEILRQLRQRFRKILVISHLEDVKDAFDTKLIVTKTTTGQSIAEVQ